MIPSRDQIRSASDLKISEPIPVPEWVEGSEIYVKVITGDAHAGWQNQIAAKRGKDKSFKDAKGIRTSLIVLSACDENGTLVFSPEDAEWLGEKSAAVVGRLWGAVTEINGIGEDAQKRLEKNSETAPTNSFGDS